MKTFHKTRLDSGEFIGAEWGTGRRVGGADRARGSDVQA
jgi:hypothetical protein